MAWRHWHPSRTSPLSLNWKYMIAGAPKARACGVSSPTAVSASYPSPKPPISSPLNAVTFLTLSPSRVIILSYFDLFCSVLQILHLLASYYSGHTHALFYVSKLETQLWYSQHVTSILYTRLASICKITHTSVNNCFTAV